MLRLACASLARFALIGIVVEIAVFGLQSLQAAIRDVERANAKFAQQQKFGIAGPNDTREQIIKKQAQATKQLARAEAERNQINRRGQAKQSVAASTVRGIDGKPVPEFSLPPSVPTTDKTRLASLNKDIQMFKQTLKLNPSAFRSEKPQPDATNTLGPGVDPQGKTKKKGKSDEEKAAERAAKEAAKEAERVAQVIRDRLAEGQLLRVKSGLQDKISAAEVDNDKMLAARLQGLQKEIDIQYQYAQALAQEKDVRAQEAIIFEGNSRLVANQRDVQRELGAIQRQREQEGLQSITAYLEKQYELNTAIQQQKALAESVSTTLGQGMTSVFDLLIQGSDNWGKSLQQIASKVLVDIANQLIRIYVIEQAVSAIKSFLSPSLLFGGGGGQIGGVGTLGPNYGIKQFANGGVPPVGRPSLVGERGPELFMPGIRGTVIPNGGFGGTTNVVVNVDASGSSVQGDQTQGKQLGLAVSAAVQAELIKQQRPGGLLAGTRR